MQVPFVDTPFPFGYSNMIVSWVIQVKRRQSAEKAVGSHTEIHVHQALRYVLGSTCIAAVARVVVLLVALAR